MQYWYFRRAFILMAFFISIRGLAQSYLFESFESGIPSTWEQVYYDYTDENGDPATSNVDWIYNMGGGDVASLRFPPEAKDGLLNAFFQEEGSRGEKTALITPFIDLSSAEIPVLTFYHAQAEWGVGTGDHEKLRVLIKGGANGDWVELESYQDPVPSWIKHEIFIPDTLFYDSAYIAFEGETNFGAGLCIDSLAFYETGIIPFQLQEAEYDQATNNFITSGTNKNQVFRVNLKTYGNVGGMKLNRISFSLPGVRPVNIASNGARLMYTERPFYNTQNQVASASLTNDSVVFNNLDYSLAYGDNYLWLALDITEGGYYDDVIDAVVNKNGINLSVDTTGYYNYSQIWVSNDTIYSVLNNDTTIGYINFTIPSSEVSRFGERLIKDKLFFEDFESTTSWTLEPDFQIGEPQGLGANDVLGNPDPENAFDGANILGTDLTGIGSKPGDYENFKSVYYATLEIQDAYYYNNLFLSYNLWMNKESDDEGYIELSVDSGYTWTKVKNYTSLSRNYWMHDTVSLANKGADYNKYIAVRFAMGPTGPSAVYSGWNIDNFSIAGNFIDYDVGVVALEAPFDKCGHTNNDSVTVWIRNYAGAPLEDTVGVPIYYQLNGGPKVYDTLHMSIGLEDSIRVTLNKGIDLTEAGYHNIYVATDFSLDEGRSNDGYSASFIAFPTYTPAFNEDFEADNGVWKTYGKNNSWEWDALQGDMLPSVNGSITAWVTRNNGNYLNLDSSFVETGCYDLNDGNRHLIEFDYWLETEDSIDGYRVQYSTNQGVSWNELRYNEFGWVWGWYTDSIKAMADSGFTGNSNHWDVARQLLPASLNNQSQVKFRFYFKSDSNNVYNGVAIDNFNVYYAPYDVGVVSVDSLYDACQYVNKNFVSVTIENKGLNTMPAGDSIVVSYQLNATTTEGAYAASNTDTIYLNEALEPGEQVKYKFNDYFEVIPAGTYTIDAYTQYEPDPWFYLSNNDSVQFSFEVKPNPYTFPNFPDTVLTKETDTVLITPYNSINYSYYWTDIDNNHPTTRDLLSSGPGFYYLTVTDTGGNGCSSFDSSYVELLFNDGGLDSIVAPATGCELGGNEIFTVRIRNFGTDSLATGEVVAVYLEVNGDSENAILDTLILEEPILRYGYVDFVMDNATKNLSDTGVYSILAYADIGGDTIPQNDTVHQQIHVYGYPYLDIGPDTIVEAYAFTLQAQEGYIDYLWNNGDTLPAHPVDTTYGHHWVTVTDRNNCSSTDTAFVRLVIRDIQPTELQYPVSSCEIKEDDPVQIIFVNYGNDTLLPGQKIYVSYQINANERVTDSIVLEERLKPGDIFEYQFSKTESFSTPDTYNFNITATSYNDLTTANDTISRAVVINNNPDINLGNDTTMFANTYTLNAGSGSNWVYLWERLEGLTNTWEVVGAEQHYEVNNSTFFAVTVTDNNTGCLGYDTILVNVYQLDIEITGTNIPAEICKNDVITPVLYIKQKGNYRVRELDCEITYGISGQTQVQYNVIYSTDMKPGENDSLVLQQALDFSSTSFDKVDFSLTVENDGITGNNKFSEYPYIFNLPNVKISGADDTLSVSSLPVNLSTTTNFEAYKWQNNSTSTSFSAANTGWYWVEATDRNGCANTDSVYVRLSTSLQYTAPDIEQVLVYPNPASRWINFNLQTEQPTNMVVKITDIAGRVHKVLETNTESLDYQKIDVSGLPEGIYQLQVLVDNELKVLVKVVIE